MAKIAELKKYLTHEFSSGSYTGEDYRTFQTKYLNYLRAVCKENHWQLVNVGKNHYCFSAFIKSAENKCVYLSIPTVSGLLKNYDGQPKTDERLAKDISAIIDDEDDFNLSAFDAEAVAVLSELFGDEIELR